MALQRLASSKKKSKEKSKVDCSTCIYVFDRACKGLDRKGGCLLFFPSQGTVEGAQLGLQTSAPTAQS